MNHPPILTANLTRETNVNTASGQSTWTVTVSHPSLMQASVSEAPEPDDPSVPDDPDPEDEKE